MTDDEWKAYLASPRAETSRKKFHAWSDREARKISHKIEKRREAIEMRYSREKHLLGLIEEKLRNDFADRKADYENQLIAADFEALGLKPGRST